MENQWFLVRDKDQKLDLVHLTQKEVKLVNNTKYGRPFYIPKPRKPLKNGKIVYEFDPAENCLLDVIKELSKLGGGSDPIIILLDMLRDVDGLIK